jgi:hypothetical protein
MHRKIHRNQIFFVKRVKKAPVVASKSSDISSKQTQVTRTASPSISHEASSEIFIRSAFDGGASLDQQSFTDSQRNSEDIKQLNHFIDSLSLPSMFLTRQLPTYKK